MSINASFDVRELVKLFPTEEGNNVIREIVETFHTLESEEDKAFFSSSLKSALLEMNDAWDEKTKYEFIHNFTFILSYPAREDIYAEMEKMPTHVLLMMGLKIRHAVILSAVVTALCKRQAIPELYIIWYGQVSNAFISKEALKLLEDALNMGQMRWNNHKNAYEPLKK